jgi:hypothetical protein
MRLRFLVRSAMDTVARRWIDTVKGGTVLFAYGIPAGRSSDGVDATQHPGR